MPSGHAASSAIPFKLTASRWCRWPLSLVAAAAARATRTGASALGLRAVPAGVFVIRNGEVKWRPAVNVNRAILGGQMVGATALLVLGTVAVAWLSRAGTAKPAP